MNPEHYEHAVNGTLAQVDGPIDLWRAGLSHVDLSGADLRGATLAGASLFDANLKGANLKGANLIQASLFAADLKGANLEMANLRQANMRKANLTGARIYGMQTQYAKMENIKGVIVSNPGLHKAVFSIKHRILGIGCEWYHIDQWLRLYQEIGLENHYDHNDIERYGRLIKWLADPDRKGDVRDSWNTRS